MGDVLVLYLTRNGLLEPLGQSQVLSYLKGLSEKHDITLVSFEKSEDMEERSYFENVLRECQDKGIQWYPQRFRLKPRLVAPLWGMMVLFFISVKEVLRGRVRVIHARSYVPAFVALGVNKLTGIPFVFDMRALWPEELITAGQIKRGSITHKVIVYLERQCIKNAAALVSLTDVAVDFLKQQYPKELEGLRVAVIPTCVDLDKYLPAPFKDSQKRVYGCVGTVLSGWFMIDWLASFFQALAKKDPNAEFEVITRDNSDAVRIKMGGDSDFQSRLKVYGVRSSEVCSAVQEHVASVMFFTPGVGKLGSSPTRMGEMLSCGLPVVVNDGVGDVANIIRKYRVGVVLNGNDRASLDSALCTLAELIEDYSLPARCRDAAKAVFSLEVGTRKYLEVYESIVSGKSNER